MMRAFQPYVDDPVLRLAACLTFLVGAVGASFAPHVSVLAVHTFALGDAGFAVMMALSTIASVGFAIAIGIRTDQTANRRGIALTCGLVWVLAQAIMSVAPGSLTFLLAHVLLFPLGASLMGQTFALARLAASVHPAEERDAIMATLRAGFALPFVVVLPIWALAFQAGADVLTIYPVSLALCLGIYLLTLAFWPRDGQTKWEDKPSGLSLRAALGELAHGPVALRVLALGSVSMGSTLYIAVIGLLMGQTPGRDEADAALYIGIVAGLEVPFMLALPILGFRASRTLQMLAGAAIYAIHMLLLPLMIESPAMWLLTLPAALGGAFTLTLPIGYLQDLLSGRPGTAAALMSLQWLAASVMAAAVFAVGTGVSGYGLALVLGAVVSVGGTYALHRADRGRAVVISS
jgi:SET family sugar efflux transporter-like MFS transporter